MTAPAPQINYPSALRRVLHPPLRETRFWIIQLIVLVIVVLHFIIDTDATSANGALAAAIPVAILVLPIGYAGLRYGLAGSFATAIWAMMLWLPDLLLPHNEGHTGADLVNLLIVLVVAFVFGQRIEAERIAHSRVEETTMTALAVEIGYRRLFETNRSPILVLDDHGVVVDANPAAQDLLGPGVIGSPGAGLVGGDQDFDTLSGQVLTLPNERDYRLDVVTLPANTNGIRRQLNFEDVTEERSEQRRTRHFAQLIVQVEEDQRRRLSRELHDEPLQLFLHLARRLELLAGVHGVPGEVTEGLDEARHQALDAAGRLRTLSRDLRPPALDQLGLVAAVSSLVADLDDGDGPDVQLDVLGTPRRLAPDIELGAFRIIQESLRNARRHAKAREVDVTIEFRPHALELRVADDGAGFDPLAAGRVATQAPSLGLVGMRERTRLLSGTLDVHSSPGHGTIIEVSMPLDVVPEQLHSITR